MRAAGNLAALGAMLCLSGCPSGEGNTPAAASPGAPPAAAAPTVSYGAVMADVGRRFEVLGRAGAARRFELAEYELGEIEETFAGALPGAERPKEGHPEVLPGQQTAFVEQVVPEVRRGIATGDPAAFTAAFGKAAERCNACHQASGHGFIEVPTQPGHTIPNLDPLPAPATPR